MADLATWNTGRADLKSRLPRPGQNTSVIATRCPVNRAQTTMATGCSTVSAFAMPFITGMIMIARHMNKMPRAAFWRNCVCDGNGDMLGGSLSACPWIGKRFGGYRGLTV